MQTSPEFEMPEGKSGFADLTAIDGSKRLALASDTVKVYRRADAGYPAMTVGPALVCAGIQFLDGEGRPGKRGPLWTWG